MKKINYIITLLTSDCNVLDESNLALYEATINSVSTSSSLSDYISKHRSSIILQRILPCINNSLLSSDIASKSYIHYNRIDQSNEMQIEVYDPLLELFEAVYAIQSEQESSLSSFAYPVKFSNQINTFSYTYRPDKEKIKLRDMRILTNPVAINQLANLSLTFEPYFILGDASNNFRPFEISQLSGLDMELKSGEVANYFLNLLKVCNVGISQQTLLSGAPVLTNLYAQLFFNNSGATYQKAIEVISSNNNVLRTNLASYIVKTEFQNNTQLFQLLQKVQEDTGTHKPEEEDLARLNTYFNFNNIKFVTVGDESVGYKLMLQVESINRKEDRFTLPLANSMVIFQQKIIYPSSIYLLLSTKDQLLSKVAEYEFTSRVNNLQNENLNKYITSTLINRYENE